MSKKVISLAEPRRAETDYTRIQAAQEPLLRELVDRLYRNVPFYREKLDGAGVRPGDIRTVADLAHVPFTTKSELRTTYPLGLMAVPEEEVVRIHSSSGTTGKPVIVPYTAADVATWAEMMARCMRLAGVGPRDRVQVTPGYGLWTAGIGFQAGVEHLGAMAIPTGPGNTEKQLEMMTDLKTSVLIGTSSYGLLLAEEVHKRGLRDQLALRVGIFGSERWGRKMRGRIQNLLDIDTFDIYGLTEIYGPGIALDCPYHNGLHYWADHLLFEIIDPETGRVLPPGEQGELVVTTLTKQGMPLLRYRTHDISRLLTAACPCGSPYPLMDRVLGRTDDMFKIKGVNIYPGQLEHVLRATAGLSCEYRIVLRRENGRDSMLLRVEAEHDTPVGSLDTVAVMCADNIKRIIGIIARVEIVPCGTLPRSPKKTQRVLDEREI